MKKKNLIITLIITAVVGSFITFYATNLLMSDLSNMFYGVHDLYIIGSFPLFFIALDFVVATIMLTRLIIKPENKRRILRLYTIYGIINSVLGLTTSIISGSLIYKNFFSTAIFPGHNFIMTIIHALLIVALVICLVKINKLPKTTKERKPFLKGVLYVLYSAAVGGLLYFAMNKFGAVLWSPSFIYWRIFYMIWPLFLSLMCPMALCVYLGLIRLNVFKSKKTRLIVGIVIFAISILSSLAVILIGSNFTEFVSAASPVLPIERLGGAPYNTIAQPIVELVVGSALIIYNIIDYKKQEDK